MRPVWIEDITQKIAMADFLVDHADSFKWTKYIESLLKLVELVISDK